MLVIKATVFSYRFLTKIIHIATDKIAYAAGQFS